MSAAGFAAQHTAIETNSHTKNYRQSGKPRVAVALSYCKLDHKAPAATIPNVRKDSIHMLCNHHNDRWAKVEFVFSLVGKHSSTASFGSWIGEGTWELTLKIQCRNTHTQTPGESAICLQKQSKWYLQCALAFQFQNPSAMFFSFYLRLCLSWTMNVNIKSPTPNPPIA